MAMLDPLATLRCYPSHDHTVIGMLTCRVATAPDRTFVEDGDRRLTYHAFQTEVRAAALKLRQAGCAHGDRVILVAPASIEFLVLAFAAWHAGLIVVPVNPDLTADEARYLFQKSEPRLVASMPDSLEVVSLLASELERSPVSWVFGQSFSVPLAPSATPAEMPKGGPDDTGIVIFTSGTTGLPKGVMHAQRTFVTTGEAFVGRMQLQPDDRMLCVLPFFHVNALFYSLAGALAAGCTLVLGGRFSASGFWPLVHRTRATQVNLIGVIGKILALRPPEEFVAGHSLDRVYCAPLAQDVKDAFVQRFGVPAICEGFGMSEIPGVTSQPMDDRQEIGTMGPESRHPDGRRLSTCRIVDDAGRDVPEDSPGRFLVKTELLMQGYFREPQLTLKAFVDGWFATGDIVRRNARGNYVFVARDKDLIRRRGENISAVELDQIVMRHPGIAEAAAVAVPSPVGEDDILLVAVRRKNASLTEAELHVWCTNTLSAVKVPRFVTFVAALPYNSSHKVQRFKLAGDSELLAHAVDFERRGKPASAARGR